MPSWPLKNRNIKIPDPGQSGSFWENRGDRRHCGIDLYTKVGDDVYNIENGSVIDVGVMTSPELIGYWNVTYYVLVENQDGTFWKYGEMSNILISINDSVVEGQKIGEVGLVLNPNKIDSNSPIYIQKLKRKNPSMLHLELFSHDPIAVAKQYLGGNWFASKKPLQLMNPAQRLL